jgi:hypothetical protein
MKEVLAKLKAALERYEAHFKGHKETRSAIGAEHFAQGQVHLEDVKAALAEAEKAAEPKVPPASSGQAPAKSAKAVEELESLPK